MSELMRTTVRLDEALMQEAKREAERRDETVTSLIEQGLRIVLARPRAARKRVIVPVSRARGGVWPGVDLDNSAAVLDILEGHS